MLDFLNIELHHFFSHYFIITTIVFIVFALLFIYPKLVPNFFYGMYKKRYLSNKEKDYLKLNLKTIDESKNNLVICRGILNVKHHLEDLIFRRRHQDINWEFSLSVFKPLYVISFYRLLVASRIDEVITKSLSFNKNLKHINNIPIEELRVKFRFKNVLYICFFKPDGLDLVYKELNKGLKIENFQMLHIINNLMFHYGKFQIYHNERVIESFNNKLKFIVVPNELRL